MASVAPRARAASLQAAVLGRRARTVLRHPWWLGITAFGIFGIVFFALRAGPSIARQFGVAATTSAMPAVSDPIAASIAAALVVAGAVAFLVAFLAELRRPRVADLAEAARAAGAPALAAVRPSRRDPDDGAPMRATRALADDPWQLVLGMLAATDAGSGSSAAGATAPILVITGDASTAVAEAAVGLARAAAEEPRGTLLIDFDAATNGAAAAFALRPEPGVADIANRRMPWTAALVTSDVGDERALDVVPAGAPGARRAALDEAAGTELVRLAARYELCIAIAPDPAMARLPGARALLVVQRARTPLVTVQRQAQHIAAAGLRLMGVVLWDAPIPKRVPADLIARNAALRTERDDAERLRDTADFPVPG
jgi:Mrp family chromosome partitioning ATPase